MARRGLKICCGVTATCLVVLVIVCVALLFTIFKPKDLLVTAHPIGLKKIDVSPPLSINVTLSLVVTIDNPNYGSFNYENTTTYVSYHGVNVAEVPIDHSIVPARGKLNISTFAEVNGDKLIFNPNFLDDLAAGCLNLTSTATLQGRVSMLKIFKKHATILNTCDISLFILKQDLESKCNSRIKL